MDVLIQLVTEALKRTRRLTAIFGAALSLLGVILFGVYFGGWVTTIEASTSNRAIEVVFVAGFTLLGTALLFRAWKMTDVNSGVLKTLATSPESIASAMRQTLTMKGRHSYVVIITFANGKSLRMVVKNKLASEEMTDAIRAVAPRAAIQMQ